MKIIKETLADDAKAYLKGYIRSADDTSAHENYPAVIVVPGGSYTHIPEQQAETLALAFANLGYQSFYLRYHFIGEKNAAVTRTSGRPSPGSCPHPQSR